MLLWRLSGIEPKEPSKESGLLSLDNAFPRVLYWISKDRSRVLGGMRDVNGLRLRLSKYLSGSNTYNTTIPEITFS